LTIDKASRYKVVINHEEQYSLILDSDPPARGWREVGKRGTAQECLKYIEEVWTDMQSADRERILRRIR
jgi:MbtH protein